MIGLPVVADLVGADVLGDAAGLALGDLGLAHRVEQRGLAVVDVAHDRDDRRAVLSSSAASSKTGSASASSAAWTISISLSNSSAMTSISSSESVCVSVAILPRPISFLISSGTGTARYSLTSLTVEPELIRIVSAFRTLASCGVGSV